MSGSLLDTNPISDRILDSFAGVESVRETIPVPACLSHKVWIRVDAPTFDR